MGQDVNQKDGAEYRGWLLKWTNYIKGYRQRWFVLSNGLLSYYRYVITNGVISRGYSPGASHRPQGSETTSNCLYHVLSVTLSFLGPCTRGRILIEHITLIIQCNLVRFLHGDNSFITLIEVYRVIIIHTQLSFALWS